MKLTIFTTCRPLLREFHHIQINAVQSWTKLVPEPEIIVVGDEEGTDWLTANLGVKRIFSVSRNHWGIPYLASLWWTALTASSSSTSKAVSCPTKLNCALSETAGLGSLTRSSTASTRGR